MNTEINALLDQTNLNWRVSKQQLQTVSGILIPDKVAIVREDTQTVLSTMGSGYEPYQNDELLELLFQISKSTGLTIHKGGEFGGGEKVYIQLKSNDLRLGNDLIKGFITGANSFDGKTSLCFGNSNITISCMNTFFAASRQLDSQLKHTVGMRPRIDTILYGIDGLLAEEKQTFEIIKRLNETPIKAETFGNVIRTIFELTPADTSETISTRKRNQMDLFKTDWANEITGKGQTLWGAFSAATRFTTHHVNKNEARRDELKIFGASGQTDRDVWKIITQNIAA